MRFAQRDVLHAAFNAFAADHIANPHLLAHHDEHAGQEILENILKGKAYGNGANAQTGKQTGRGQAGQQDRRSNHQACHPDRDGDQRIDQGLERGTDFGAPGHPVGNLASTFGKQPSDEDDENGDRQKRQ